MIFLECGVIALIEAVYMFRDHNHVKSFDMLNDFISSCSAQVTISQEVAKFHFLNWNIIIFDALILK